MILMLATLRSAVGSRWSTVGSEYLTVRSSRYCLPPTADSRSEAKRRFHRDRMKGPRHRHLDERARKDFHRRCPLEDCGRHPEQAQNGHLDEYKEGGQHAQPGGTGRLNGFVRLARGPLSVVPRDGRGLRRGVGFVRFVRYWWSVVRCLWKGFCRGVGFVRRAPRGGDLRSRRGRGRETRAEHSPRRWVRSSRPPSPATAPARPRATSRPPFLAPRPYPLAPPGVSLGSPLPQLLQDPHQGPVARELISTQPLARLAVVESQRLQPGRPVPLQVQLQHLLQPLLLLGDHLQQLRLARLRVSPAAAPSPGGRRSRSITAPARPGCSSLTRSSKPCGPSLGSIAQHAR